MTTESSNQQNSKRSYWDFIILIVLIAAAIYIGREWGKTQCPPSQIASESLKDVFEKSKLISISQLFNRNKKKIKDTHNKFAGLKLDRNNLKQYLDSCKIEGDIYIAIAVDANKHKMLLIAPAPRGGDSWDTTEPHGNGRDIKPGSKDTIWYVFPDIAEGSSIGTVPSKNTRLFTWKDEQSNFDKGINHFLKLSLPGKELYAGPTQGCPKKCSIEVSPANLSQ